MGATTFITRAKGANAKEAFAAAVEQARYEHGHGGYTGTIAEKDRFVMVFEPLGVSPQDYANKLMGEGDSRIDDKWGPAGCIKVAEGEYLFFGWASD